MCARAAPVASPMKPNSRAAPLARRTPDGFDSWLALRFKSSAMYLDTLRECYEAFVLYHFLQFLIAYLDTLGGAETILACKPQQAHLWPMGKLYEPWRSACVHAVTLRSVCCRTRIDASRVVSRHSSVGTDFLNRCINGVLNYVILRVVLAGVAFIADARGFYGEGELLNPWRAYAWIVSLNSWAASHAIYCLLMLFTAVRVELEAINPVAKFVCVKFVVFFSFWQALAIVVMVHARVLSSKTMHLKDYDVRDVSNGLQDFIICVESPPLPPFFSPHLTQFPLPLPLFTPQCFSRPAPTNTPSPRPTSLRTRRPPRPAPSCRRPRLSLTCSTRGT